MNIQDYLQLNLLQQTNNSKMNVKQRVFAFIIMIYMSYQNDFRSVLLKIFEQFRKKYIINSDISKKIEEKKLEFDCININEINSMNKVYLTRTYEHDKSTNNNSDPELEKQMNEMIDSLFEYLSNLKNIPILELIKNGTFVIVYKEKPIQISEDIYLQVHHYEKNDLCSFKYIKITLISKKLSSSDIKQFVYKIYEEYKLKMENKLHDNIYYFEYQEKQKVQIYDPRGDVVLKKDDNYFMSLPKKLSFVHRKYYSNKTFENLYGIESKEIYKQIEFFTHNKNWYDKKGLPYHLTIMMVGVPGCGKTTCIKALANYTKRHIINVNFKNIKTVSQLRNLFYTNEITVNINNEQTNTLKIPVEKRLYILEEIDAINDIVKQRETHQRDTSDDKKCEEKLTLGEILTVFDGILEIPGRIIIITSNHPENIDKAFMRPGRIDQLIYFKNTTIDDICEMYKSIFEKEFPEEYKNKLPNNILSFAEVQQVFIKHLKYNNYNEIIEDLNTFKSVRESNINFNVKNGKVDDYLIFKSAQKENETISEIQNMNDEISEPKVGLRGISDQQMWDPNAKSRDEQFRENILQANSGSDYASFVLN